MAGIPGPLVFVQDNLPVRVHLAGTVYPHVTLAPGISPVFIYQHGRLIRLQDMVIVQFSMQIIIKHCQISVRTLDGPVGHVLAGNRQAVPFKLLFLAVKGNGIDIFCVHDGSLQRWRY